MDNNTKTRLKELKKELHEKYKDISFEEAQRLGGGSFNMVGGILYERIDGKWISTKRWPIAVSLEKRGEGKMLT